MEKTYKTKSKILWKKGNLKCCLIKITNKHKIEFWIDNQGFTLEYGGTSVEAIWMGNMLKKAFNNYKPYEK